jgi:hypothetical protein
MATHIQGVTIVQDNTSDAPVVSYVITYTAVRNSNGTVTYTFTIKCYLKYTGSSFGPGKILRAIISVNGVNSEVYLITSGEEWKTGSNLLKATKTITVTCASYTSNELQTVQFKVVRDDGGKYSGMVANTGSKYYVISPEVNALSNCFINVNGVIKRGLCWIKDNGVWKQGTPWIKKDGIWKKGG